MIYHRIDGSEAAAFRDLYRESLQKASKVLAVSPDEIAWTITDAQQFLMRNYVVGAYDRDELVGFVVATPFIPAKLAHRAMLGNAYIRSEYRGGTGSGLINAALATLQTYGIRVVLGCIVITNAASQRMVENAGFERLGIERDGMKVGDEFVDVVHVVRYLGPSPEVPRSS